MRGTKYFEPSGPTAHSLYTVSASRVKFLPFHPEHRSVVLKSKYIKAIPINANGNTASVWMNVDE